MREHRSIMLAGIAFLALAPAVAYGQVAPSAGPSLPSATPGSMVTATNTQTDDASVGVPPQDTVGEIIVTAQKRSESINKVPISITAASGVQLAKQGIVDPASLVKIVPGLQFTPSLFATPVFSLRGVGFYDGSFAATSAVAVYVDEVPLPFTVMTGGAVLDLERVEVLKGPQGTLFGQNATGGAINFVAAKPTSDLRTGFDAGINHFGRVDLSGYVSGPLSDQLRARVAVSTSQFGAWQKSYTRDDKRGDQDRVSGRLLLDWTPTERLTLMLSGTGWADNSEVPAAQFLASTPNVPSAELPALANYPLPPSSNRFADWTPGTSNRRDARFYQLSARVNYELTDEITLVSVSSLSRFRERRSIDIDGTAIDNIQVNTRARIRDFSQELRIQGDMDQLRWILGANHQKSSVYEFNATPFNEASVRDVFSFATPVLYYGASYFSDQNYRTQAVFGNVDFDLISAVTLHGGIRYSDQKAGSTACSLDDTGGVLSSGYGAIFQQVFPRGGCVNYATTPLPGGGFTVTPGLAVNSLREDNISWRAGVDYKPTGTALLYVSASKGYKSGSFPTVNAATQEQFAAARQEGLLSYEAGVKLGFFNRNLQFNAAVFYYDYREKQFRGRIINNPNIFGPVETLLNIPRSRVTGAEVQITASPISGLVFTGGGTYLDSKVLGDFVNYNTLGQLVQFGGERFPLTPRWQAVGDVDYQIAGAGRIEPFFGATARYQSATTSAFGDPPLFNIKAYELIDLRAGIANQDAGWRFSVFVRNVGNTYYWNNATKLLDTAIRFAGEPRTFGANLSLRLK